MRDEPASSPFLCTPGAGCSLGALSCVSPASTPAGLGGYVLLDAVLVRNAGGVALGTAAALGGRSPAPVGARAGQREEGGVSSRGTSPTSRRTVLL